MDKKFISLLSLFFLIFGIFAGAVIFNKPITSFLRAREEIQPTAENSLVLAWPLNIKSDGTTQSHISVFVRSSTGKPSTSIPVTATTTLGTLEQSVVTSDNEGKAVFNLTSTEKGTANIEVLINNVPVNQKISIQFE